MKAKTKSTSFSNKTQGESRGNDASTRNLALANSGNTAQCQRAEPGPGNAADHGPMPCECVKTAFELSCCTRVSDTTLSSAVENRTRSESSTRDPSVLVLRRR